MRAGSDAGVGGRRGGERRGEISVTDLTKTQVQKKQSRTQEELAAEMENEMGDEEPESEESEEEGEKPIYNPKKVPPSPRFHRPLLLPPPFLLLSSLSSPPVVYPAFAFPLSNLHLFLPLLTSVLQVPLDWTGKPIPYWLYKLHGLNIEYKCEICGNYSYWGPRAFERHFQEWRHAHGMRCLK
eukprot:470054-Hanusia_phi.AAC.1